MNKIDYAWRWIVSNVLYYLGHWSSIVMEWNWERKGNEQFCSPDVFGWDDTVLWEMYNNLMGWSNRVDKYDAVWTPHVDWEFEASFALPATKPDPEEWLDILYEIGFDDAIMGINKMGAIGINGTISASSDIFAMNAVIGMAETAGISPNMLLDIKVRSSDDE